MSMWSPHLWCIVAILCQVSCSENYYWRLYTGSAPDDAVVAGHDSNGRNIYVGQAYMNDGGMIPAQIYDGVKEVEVPWDGAIKKDKFIYILCGQQENFQWLRTDTNNLYLDLLDKRPVLGGFYEGYGYYYIARIFTEGETIIGKIHQFDVANPYMDFVVKHVEKTSKSFEVLCYQGSVIDERIDKL